MKNVRINKSLIAQGDQANFKQLMNLTADDLYLFAMGFVRNKEVAEEIVSDVFVKIWNKRTELENINNLKSYLFISVKNACLSYLRKTKNEKNISIDEFSDYHFPVVEDPENEYIDKENLEEIYNCIEQLPPKCKMAFTLAKINGLRYKEIAEIMGVSEKTVNNHLVNAIQKITKTLAVNKKRDNQFSPFKHENFVSC